MTTSRRCFPADAALFALFVTMGGAISAAEPSKEAPIQDRLLLFADLEKAGFKALKRLKDGERAEFFRAYPVDQEMLSRARFGPIDSRPPNECIAGEAPSLAVARKTFPLHYPMMGRMQGTSGVFEWNDKKLIFRTDSQQYHVDEYHILHRLEKLGLNRDSGPRRARISAVWMVNTLDGLRLIYIQNIELH